MLHNVNQLGANISCQLCSAEHGVSEASCCKQLPAVSGNNTTRVVGVNQNRKVGGHKT